MRGAMAILVTLGLAVPAAMASNTNGAPPPRKPRLDLRAAPRIAFSPVQVHLTAEFVGGDPHADFHCPTLEWDWDDGSRSVRESDCEALEDGGEFERRYTANHAYLRAGIYNVQVTVKNGQRKVAVATASVNVRPGAGDVASEAEFGE